MFFTYLKGMGLVLLCLMLGMVVLALLPFITAIGLGGMCLVIVYCLIQASKMDIDDEVDKLKTERRSKRT